MSFLFLVVGVKELEGLDYLDFERLDVESVGSEVVTEVVECLTDSTNLRVVLLMSLAVM